MRATVMHGPCDVRVENVPDARIVEPTDAVITVLRAAICGSDLWPYQLMTTNEPARRMGHEAVGVVVEVGKEVRSLKKGDVVMMPFAYSDGTCEFCHEGLNTSCTHGGFFGGVDNDGGQAEAMRIPQADGTLYKLPQGFDSALLPSLLTLTDVMGTGHHAAVTSRVGPGKRVAVVGDGAVGLCGVLAAKRLGAEQIIVLGRHEARTRLALEFGASDIVGERGEAAIERVRELTHGVGVHSVLECVGTEQAIETSLGIVRPGGAVGRVGVPHYGPVAMNGVFFKNVTVGGGPAPARAYMPQLLPDVLAHRIDPGRVFDATLALEESPDGYRAMFERRSIKAILEVSNL